MKKINKVVVILLILTMLMYILSNIINENKSYAAVVQTREPVSSKLNNYPGYTELIQKMRQAHPNWNFTIHYTNLDWNQVIKNETVVLHGRNLVSASSPSSWFCQECLGKTYDGRWKCASEGIVSYYIDPRNSLNENYVFQFETLSFNKDSQTIEGVKQILNGISYMQGNSISYKKTDGTNGVINKSYAQVIMEVGEKYNISPYHLAARMRQEQGANKNALISGEYPGYIGYYNYFNIQATGSTETQKIQNGLSYAQRNGLTDPEKSIGHGAEFLVKGYIGVGQDTLYLQKFDVDSNGTLYQHQYMQNLSASKSEGASVRSSYQDLGLLDQNMNFVIPVYENMPQTACGQPDLNGIVTKDVKVNGTKVNVRADRTTNSAIIAEVNTGDILLKIEEAAGPISGIYWDKVVLPDGRKGYISRAYISNIEDIKNCNDTVIASTSVNLRNGPGTSGTNIITTLTKGQIMTRIETGKYNMDGYIWDRVVLPDGRRGYLVQDYIELTTGGNDGSTGKPTAEIIKVICNSGVKVREEAGTSASILDYLDKGDLATRTQAGVSNANGYIWDKIVTSKGIEGYIARGDSKESYIEVVQDNDTGNNPSTDPYARGDVNRRWKNYSN